MIENEPLKTKVGAWRTYLPLELSDRDRHETVGAFLRLAADAEHG